MKKWILVSAILAMGFTGCTTPGKRTAIGAGAGAAGGAAAGAAIGAIAGDAGKGAWIGAAAGAVLGTAIGNRMDKQAKELAALAETKRTENGIITTLKNNILFDSGKTEFKPAAKDSLDQISDIIKKYPENHVIVVGYTDSSGPEDINQALSERRAKAVRLQMVSRGVPAASVESMGQGESNPVATNDTAEGRAKNRRVELQISMVSSKAN